VTHRHIYMIAGEASGDLLGAGLMKALKQQSTDDIEFSGIGGVEMTEQGLQSLFPMETLSVMGVFEVLPRIPDLLKRIRMTIRDIEEKQPDVIVTIDSPDFCFRVVKAIKARGKAKAPRVHYVAPSVWAWRPGRAKKVAQFLDHILALLPFEPPYFEKEGLDCTFIGHPMIEKDDIVHADGQAFRGKHDIPAEQKLLCVLPGSRNSELKRMLPVFQDVLKRLSKTHPDLKVVSVTLPHLKERIQQAFSEYDVMVTDQDKYNAFAASDAAIATSGTVALELGMTRTPSVIGYKMNAINTMLVKLLVKTKYVTLPNIILDRAVMPELLLEACTAEGITAETEKLLTDPAAVQAQKDGFDALYQAFDGLSPSTRGAEVVLSLLGEQKKTAAIETAA